MMRSQLHRGPTDPQPKRFPESQNQYYQPYPVKLFTQAGFCINSQKKQKIGFQNVLDQLTLSEKESEKINSFSQSLVRSANGREEQQRKIEKTLKGPPHKKFASLQSSVSDAEEKIPSFKKNPSVVSKNSEQSNQNIYYTRSSQNRHQCSKFSAQKSKSPLPLGTYYERFQHSSRQVCEPSARTVQAKNSTPQKTPVQSPQNSMFLNSSQYSQKDNVQHNKISSIYLNKEQSESGQFLHFEKDSIAKSEVKDNEFKVQKGKEIDYDVHFQDSMKLQQSQSQELLQYGMDKGAKLPTAEKKPPFAFKQAQTNDQSQILKQISEVDKFSIKKSSEQQKNSRPLEQSPVKFNNLIDSRPDQNILQKRTEKTKAAPKSEDYRSPTKQSERMETIKSPKSIYLNEAEPQFSQSQIRQLSAQPYSHSASNSLSSGKVPSNFGSFFRKNTKKEKASSLSSSRSFRKIKIPSKQIEIPDFKKMRDLQNQLGRLKQQTENYSKLLIEKTKQKQVLQTKKQKLVEEDPYFLKRQNQLIKTMLKKKNKEEPLTGLRGSAQQLAKELKESSIKNNTVSLKDYNPEVLKIKMENIHGYSKDQKKHMVANRCVILKNQSLEIGYSLKNKIVTLYFTLKHHCDSLQIHLLENSVIYSESIQRQFDKVFVGKQIKFKTQIEGTKDTSPFVKSSVDIKLSYEQKMQKKTQEYSAELPLTLYNIAAPVPTSELSSFSQSRQSISHYVTPLYNSCQDLMKKRQKYLEYLFPHGQFDPETNTFTVGYLWKEKVQNIRIKVKQRAFRIQGSGSPLETGRELIQALINMLVEPNPSE